MNGNRRTIETGPGSASQPRYGATGGGSKTRIWVNWVMALLTVPGAAIVMLFALGAVMSTDSCTQSQCPNLGGGINFDVLFYGPPVIALLVIAASVFTARRRAGIVVPLVGWALLVADVAILVLTVAH
ncbi:hypothetical protein [Mycobacterium angelicum]|uniref:Uncharacterized protein n=1 Tax=Mycobacterium angelicum TaxID=470074 RepID=A0A1W9ZFU5_MYCAN|nr:hypothetical protein [Mycobacterium angelicum]MCV7198706.1 hypothetical protein [Mycobacterium angelicum]ORA14239.1 hypothetical protein BST12_22975 [Mycobacterium angelicum]